MKPEANFQNDLRALSSVMARSHKMMFESEIMDLELKTGQTFNAAGKLHVLLNAPELAWLRTMSKLMAAIDEVFFQKEPIRTEQMKEVFEKVNALMFNAMPSEFTSNYRRMLTSLPDLMVEHAHLRTALKNFEKHK